MLVNFEEFKQEVNNIGGIAHHHEHLGGCVKPHILWEIAKSRGINPMGVNDYNYFMSRYVIGDMDHDDYVDNKFKLTHSIQSSPEAVKSSIMAAASTAYRESCVTKLEIRFNPMFRNQDALYDLDVIIMAAIQGANLAMMTYDMKVGIILEADRRSSIKDVQIIADKAIKYKSAGVCGFDISGGSDEPINNFSVRYGDVYAHLHENGVKTTAHLGEVGDVKELYGALDDDRQLLDRIGHGIHAYNCGATMRDLYARNICLEVCPTSNVRLGVVRNWEQMATLLRRFYDKNVPFSINTDATEFMGISVLQEYWGLYQQGIFDLGEIKNIMINSHKYSFV